MKTGMILAALLCSLALASAQSYIATLDPSQDGGGGRQGSGVVNLTLSGTTLSFSGSFAGLSANANNAHIHGPSGLFPNSAGVLYNLGNNGIPLGATSGTILGSVNLVPLQSYTVQQQLNDLNNQLWYVNIHSTAFPGGEIRGQILPVPEPSTWALMGFGVLGMIWSLRRRKA